MINYIIRRLLLAIPTLLVISFIIFAILDLAPNDPTGNLPMTVPPEVREKIRVSLGLDQPMHIRFGMWLIQFFVNEPLNILHEAFGISIGDVDERTRILSWATRSPVVDLIIQRTPPNTMGCRVVISFRYFDSNTHRNYFSLQTIFMV